jgi:hypothetical protein
MSLVGIRKDVEGVVIVSDKIELNEKGKSKYRFFLFELIMNKNVEVAISKRYLSRRITIDSSDNVDNQHFCHVLCLISAYIFFRRHQRLFNNYQLWI